MNKKIKVLISLLSVICLFSAVQVSNGPIILTMIRIFIQSIANYYIGILLVSVYYILYKKYGDEFTSKDILYVLITSLVLFILMFLIQNPITDTHFSNIQVSMDWVYLIDIALVSLYILLKKKNINISKNIIFLVYCGVALTLGVLCSNIENDIISVLLYSFAQLSSLFWINRFMDKERSRSFIIEITVIALVCCIWMLILELSIFSLIIFTHLLILLFVMIIQYIFKFIKEDGLAILIVGLFVFIYCIQRQITGLSDIIIPYEQGKISIDVVNLILSQCYLFMNVMIVYLFLEKLSLKWIFIFNCALCVLSFVFISDINFIFQMLMSLFIVVTLYCVKKQWKIQYIILIIMMNLIFINIIVTVFQNG